MQINKVEDLSEKSDIVICHFSHIDPNLQPFPDPLWDLRYNPGNTMSVPARLQGLLLHIVTSASYVYVNINLFYSINGTKVTKLNFPMG